MEAALAKKYILVEIKDGVGLLTIDRPESLNALNTAVVKELEAGLHALAGDPAVRAVVLTGAGQKAFISGGDIQEMLALDAAGVRAFCRGGQRLVLFIESLPKPVLAAVNGYALGGGLELALACDFMYASDTARLGLPEVTLGVMPGFGGTQNLARLLGPNRAKELIFSGRILSAAEALEWGLVNAVFPPSELLERALESARRIARNGALAVAAAKQAIVTGLNQSKPDGFRTEAGLFVELFASSDQKEGMSAFLEKRKPEFKDPPPAGREKRT
jgi:enoyl-CoA hydratase